MGSNGSVMYGTIGLALDISTVVQEVTRPNEQQTTLWMSGVTGLLNSLLIVIGGHGFLPVPSGAKPQASPPPNPPSRFST